MRKETMVRMYRYTFTKRMIKEEMYRSLQYRMMPGTYRYRAHCIVI
jgi:hypothetical protein